MKEFNVILKFLGMWMANIPEYTMMGYSMSKVIMISNRK